MLRKLEEKVETLVKAGLTLNQAKLYLALAEAGQMTACELAQYTGVARQDIYRVVSELQKTGLVERRLSRPAVFAAAPVEQVLVKLIELKAREYETLRQKIHALLEQLKETSLTRQKPTPDMQFTVIAGKQAILNRLKKAAYEAEKSIDVVTSRTRFSLAIVEFASAYIKALQKGVRIHIAVDKHTPYRRRRGNHERTAKKPVLHCAIFQWYATGSAGDNRRETRFSHAFRVSRPA